MPMYMVPIYCFVIFLVACYVLITKSQPQESQDENENDEETTQTTSRVWGAWVLILWSLGVLLVFGLLSGLLEHGNICDVLTRKWIYIGIALVVIIGCMIAGMCQVEAALADDNTTGSSEEIKSVVFVWFAVLITFPLLFPEKFQQVASRMKDLKNSLWSKLCKPKSKPKIHRLSFGKPKSKTTSKHWGSDADGWTRPKKNKAKIPPPTRTQLNQLLWERAMTNCKTEPWMFYKPNNDPPRLNVSLEYPQSFLQEKFKSPF